MIIDNNTNVTAKDQTEATTSSASSHLKNSVLASSSSSSAPNTSGDTVSSNSNKSTNRSRKRKSNSSKFKYTLQDHLNVCIYLKNFNLRANGLFVNTDFSQASSLGLKKKIAQYFSLFN